MRYIKHIFFLILLVFAINSNAQNLTQQMYYMYNGHVKTLIQRVQGVPGETKIDFDRQGRVVSIVQPGNSKMLYTWHENGNDVEIKSFVGDLYLGKLVIKIKEMKPSMYSYQCDGIDYEVSFNSNGSFSYIRSSGGGYTRLQSFFYDKNSMFPYKSLRKTANESITYILSALSADEHQNVTKFSTQVDNHTTITYNEIEYYQKEEK